MWTFRAEGRLFHSGLPLKGINSMELAVEAMAYIQNKFYQDFPPVSIGLRRTPYVYSNTVWPAVLVSATFYLP